MIHGPQPVDWPCKCDGQIDENVLKALEGFHTEAKSMEAVGSESGVTLGSGVDLGGAGKNCEYMISEYGIDRQTYKVIQALYRWHLFQLIFFCSQRTC